MNIHDVPIFGNTIDKSEIPPIHQKRILAFVNHFIIKTCSFLNDFALKCESRFIDVERKLQKVEASLLIIESKVKNFLFKSKFKNIVKPTQLSSIPGLENKSEKSAPTVEDKQSIKEELNQEPQSTDHTAKEIEEIQNVEEPTVAGIKACDDARYKKYFKMVQFGVPANAVKMKMETEGFDPNILNNPDATLPDGIPSEEPAT